MTDFKALAIVVHSSPVAAVFMRNMMEAINDKDEVPLRQAQEKGQRAVDDMGGTISVAYISKLSRRIEGAQVLTRRREGRKFFLTRGSQYRAMTDYLEQNPNWGATLEQTPDLIAQAERILVAGHLNDHNHAIRVNAERKLPREAWSFLMKMYYDGKLDMAFFPTDHDVFVRPNGGKAAKIVEGDFSSDAIQEIVNA